MAHADLGARACIDHLAKVPRAEGVDDVREENAVRVGLVIGLGLGGGGDGRWRREDRRLVHRRWGSGRQDGRHLF